MDCDDRGCCEDYQRPRGAALGAAGPSRSVEKAASAGDESPHTEGEGELISTSLNEPEKDRFHNVQDESYMGDTKEVFRGGGSPRLPGCGPQRQLRVRGVL